MVILVGNAELSWWTTICGGSVDTTGVDWVDTSVVMKSLAILSGGTSQRNLERRLQERL